MSHQQPAGGQASPPDTVKRIISNARSLASQDAALLKAQLSRTAAHGGKAAGAGGAVAVLMLYVVGFFGLAGGAALAQYTDLYEWAAWAIVGGIFLVIALIAGLFAKSQASSAATATQVATNQIKEDVEWAKQQIKR